MLEMHKKKNYFIKKYKIGSSQSIKFNQEFNFINH